MHWAYSFTWWLETTCPVTRWWEQFIFYNKAQLPRIWFPYKLYPARENPSDFQPISWWTSPFCCKSLCQSPTFIQILEKYQNLVSSSIEKKNFKGKIPNSMGKLQKLETLMVTDNLFSGEIPDIFCNLTWLYELNMANNRLSGRIPMSIATCQR